jgi:hypothetical protein
MTNTPRKITTSSGKEVFIYDDLYDWTARSYFYDFAVNSKYTPLSNDTTLIEHRGDFNLASHFNEADLIALRFLSNESSHQLKKHFDGFEITQVRINLSTLNDKNRIHIDNTKQCKTLIYYLNLEWKIEWGGGLLIVNDDMKEIESAISYVPGRVIVMDGTIPHCISAPTILAPSYRLSLAIQYAAK